MGVSSRKSQNVSKTKEFPTYTTTTTVLMGQHHMHDSGESLDVSVCHTISNMTSTSICQLTEFQPKKPCLTPTPMDEGQARSPNTTYNGHKMEFWKFG